MKQNRIIIKYLAIGILVFLAINIPEMVLCKKNIIEGLEGESPTPSVELNTLTPATTTPSPSGEDINDLLQKLEDVEQPPIHKERIIQCIQAFKNLMLYSKSGRLWNKILKYNNIKNEQKSEMKKMTLGNFGLLTIFTIIFSYLGSFFGTWIRQIKR